MRKFNDILDIPREYVSKISKITIIGCEEIIIENYKSILEYENFFVRVLTFENAVIINGMDLSLSQVNLDDISIKGKINGVNFESKGDNEC